MTKILVIDDEPDVRDAMHAALSRSGHEVRVAPDGPAGIRACREWRPEVLITDIFMPRAHGFDVIGQLRTEFPDLCIIAISGGGNFGKAQYQPEAVTTTAYLAAALEWGANAILRKPFDRAELLEAISKALDGKPARA